MEIRWKQRFAEDCRGRESRPGRLYEGIRRIVVGTKRRALFAPAFANERLGYDGVWRVSHRIGISVGIDDAGQSKMAASDIDGVNFCCSFHKRFLFVLRHPRSAAVNGGDAAGFGAQGASGIQP